MSTASKSTQELQITPLRHSDEGPSATLRSWKCTASAVSPWACGSPKVMKTGCPILRAFCEGWDKQTLRGRASGEEQWHPTLRQRREGWGTRSFVAGQERQFSTVPQFVESSRAL